MGIAMESKTARRIAYIATVLYTLFSANDAVGQQNPDTSLLKKTFVSASTTQTIEDTVKLAPFSQEYELNALVFNVNGLHNTVLSYEHVIDDTSRRDNEKIVGKMHGTAEISLNLGIVKFYYYVEMLTYIKANGLPMQSITVVRNEQKNKPMDISKLFLQYEDDIEKDDSNPITSAWNGLFLGDKAYSIGPQKPTKWEMKYIPSNSYDFLGALRRVLENPVEGKTPFNIHYWGNTQSLVVNIEKVKKRKQKEFYRAQVDIPEVMLDVIDRIQFDYYKGQPPFSVKAHLREYGVSAGATAITPKTNGNNNK